MKTIAVINGPNLNLLGTRQPEVYGTTTLADLEEQIARWGKSQGIEVTCAQTNDESEMITLIQRSAGSHDALIVNAGGFTHTSVAIADAVASIPIPVAEVHISDINKREAFRRKSLIEPNAVIQISGRGAVGYRDAMRHLVNRSAMTLEQIRYGPHPRNVADFRGTGSADALVILVHGGYWFSGWDRDQLDSAAIDLTRRGYDTLNLEYRLEPAWPGSAHDVASAVALARRRHDRIALIGHSAGGYLALWSHARNPVDLCIGLASVTDLTIVDDVPATTTITDAGGPAQVPIGKNVALFHGANDDEVARSHTERAEGEATIEILDGVGHFDIVSPDRPHWERIVSTLSGRLDI